MPVTNADCGVWSLDEVYLKISANKWVCYSPANDPGTLWSWGTGYGGQLGNNTTGKVSSPIQIPGISWMEISPGGNHSLARKSDMTLWSWGYNQFGILGDNTLINRSSPIQVPGTSWVEVAAGMSLSLARKSDGTLWSWGYNGNGRLGLNTSAAYPADSRSSPTQIPGTSWSDIATSGIVSLARKTDGTLWSWGYNVFGQLGLNDRVQRSSPVQIPGTAWVEASAAGGAGTGPTLARKTDGTLWSWGYNGSGALGLNDRVNRSSPAQVPGTAWVEVSTQGYLSAARKSDNTLWVWGRNFNGELGLNNTVQRSSPTQIPGTSWIEVSVGGNPIDYFVLARKSDGTLWSWGRNRFAELGDNTGITRSSPVQVPGTQWLDISAGVQNALARKSV